VPLGEARLRYPPELGFKVSHADYVCRGENGEPLVIPTTVVQHPGMSAQWFPELPPGHKPHSPRGGVPPPAGAGE
jgi:hypothetical protein